MNDFAGTRRDVLRRGAGAVGAASLVGNAGCMGILGGGNYSQWLPEPGTIRDREHYWFNMHRPSSLAKHEDEFSYELLFDETFDNRLAPANLDWAEAKRYLRFDGVTIAEADFERDEVVSDFENDDYERVEDYEDFALMLGPDEQQLGAVGDDALFTGVGYADVDGPVETAETIIDTKNGDVDGYRAVSDDFVELMGELGGGDLMQGFIMAPVGEPIPKRTEALTPERGRFENQVARADQLSVDGEQSEKKWVLVFESNDDVDVGAVEDWVESSQENEDEGFTNWADLEVTKNGRTVVIEGTADTSEI